jgi:hypothetical protein
MFDIQVDQEQRTGLIGQTTMCDLFHAPRPTSKGGVWDNGCDINFEGLKTDVKTMGRTVKVRPEFINNFIGHQKDFPTDIYIFCSLNKKTNVLTVCGWATKHELLAHANMFIRGSERVRSDGSSFLTKADLYEIGNKWLRKSDSPEELLKQLRKKKEEMI